MSERPTEQPRQGQKDEAETPPESLIEFPAEMSVKAMGLDADDFAACVESIVVPHLDGAKYEISLHPSRTGKYVAVRMHFTARNLEQLHAIYAALRQESRVLYLL